jgi:Lon protease-like protein
MMSRIRQIPLFPLNTVLFPGQIIPLHIFEPRYHAMIQECLVHDGVFGVVLIRQGLEVGGNANPFEIGTTARIKQVSKLEDGSLDIISVGEQRFKILSLARDHPYLVGEIDVLPWDPVSDDHLQPVLPLLQGLVKEYLEILGALTGNQIEIENLPADPGKLTILAAIALRISNAEKQAILSTGSQAEMMDACIQYLRRENSALRITSAIPDPRDHSLIYYSPN